MKAKIFVVVMIFLIMGTIPIVTILGDYKNSAPVATENTKPTEKSKTPVNLTDDEIIKGQIYAVYDESFNDDTIKSLAILFKTNLKADKNSVDLNNKDIFISTEEFRNTNSSFTEINSKITSAISAVKDTYIYHNNEIEYIPYSQCSQGFTEQDEKYPDLLQIASPWDKQSKNFSADNKCVGVSIDGVIFLTQNYDYLTALKWYLPKYEIKNTT